MYHFGILDMRVDTKKGMTKIKGLNIFFVLIFVVFSVDDPHFDRIFKMILVCIKCLK